MLRREAEPDKRDIGVLPRGHRGDRRDVDLAGDHFVPEAGDNLGEQLQPVTPLVGDQDTQVLNLVLDHQPLSQHSLPQW